MSANIKVSEAGVFLPAQGSITSIQLEGFAQLSSCTTGCARDLYVQAGMQGFIVSAPLVKGDVVHPWSAWRVLLLLLLLLFIIVIIIY